MMSRVSVLAAIVSVALGCSPANLAAPADAGSGDGATACTDFAFARCSHLQTCSPTAVQLRYGDVATCESVFKSVCLGAIAAPSTGTTAATEEACAQAIPGWGCSDYLYNQNPPPSCGAVAGLLPAGAACAFPGQCQSAFCAVPPGSACGVCAPLPKPGDPCAQLTTCGLSLVCAAATSTCAAYAQVGAACAPGQPCTSGLACVGANAKTGAAGTCEPEASTLGTACSFTGAGCDLFAGLACNAATSQCATAQIASEGFACGIVADQSAYCAATGSCVAGACLTGVPVGAPCDTAAGPQCFDLLRCVVTSGDGGTAGTCQAPSAVGCL